MQDDKKELVLGILSLCLIFFWFWISDHYPASEFVKISKGILNFAGIIIGIATLALIVAAIYLAAREKEKKEKGTNADAVLRFIRYILSILICMFLIDQLRQFHLSTNVFFWLMIVIIVAVIGINLGYLRVKKWLKKEIV